MSESVRIQRKRTKGWRIPENTVYVGRPTRWGNPFTGENAVERYREAVSIFPVSENTMNAWTESGGNKVMLILLAGRHDYVKNRLRGKNLACWCPLDKPCHADILLEIAKGYEQNAD